MNKKIGGKFILCALFCICFVAVGNHMPLLMGAVYDAVFGEFDHITLFFVMGVLLLEIVIIKRWKNDSRCVYLCLGMAVIAAVFVLSQGGTSFVDKLSPGADTTLISRMVTDTNIEEDNIREIFAEYYFADKNLIIPDEGIKDQEEYQYLYRMAVPESDIVVADEEPAVSDETAEWILSYPNRQYGSAYFVVDDTWEDADNIITVSWEDKYIFCPEELFQKAMASSGGTDIFYGGSDWDVAKLAGAMPWREVKQILAMLLLFLVGCAVSLPIWGKDYPWLSFFLSLPMGTAVWCVCGMVFMICNIPYNLLSMTGCILVLAAIWLFRKRSVLREMNWQAFLNFVLAAVTVAVLFAYYKACYTSADSLSKCEYAFRLARFGSVRDILGQVAPYGMLEPIIMSIGYLLKCDALYVFYPLMAICGIGIMITGLYYINGKKDNDMSMAVLGAGLLLLFTNFDFVMSFITMLAQGPTAVYTLTLLMSVVMKKKMNMPGFEWIAVISATMISLTRVEGAVYVLFFLTVALGIEDESLRLDKVNVLTAGVIVVWNVAQLILIGRNSNPMFWNPGRGMILIAGSAAVLAVTWLVRRRWVWIDYVKKHYFSLLLAGVCLGTVVAVIFMERETASINLPPYLSHFSNNSRMNDRINAGAFWSYVLLLAPIAMRDGDRLKKYVVTTIGGYLVLLYFVCLFRFGAYLHYGQFDSARRTLVQIMPAAVWLLAYSIGNREETDEVEDEKTAQ